MKPFQRSCLVNSSPEEVAGFASRGFFWWLNSFLYTGSRRLLSDDDLLHLDSSLSSQILEQQLRAGWVSWPKSGQHPLLWAVLWCYRRSLSCVILPRVCVILLRFAQPLLIHRALSLISEPDSPSKRSKGLGLVGAALVIYCGIAVGIAQYKHQIYRSMMRLRGGLVSLIYDATLALDTSAAGDAAAVTLMSADVDRIMSGIEMFDVIWATPIEVSAAIIMLARQLGWACLAPVFISLLCTWATFRLGIVASKYQKIWVDSIQERIAATASMLSGIKSFKMTGVTDLFSNYLQSYRQRELRKSKSFRKVETAQQAAGNLSLVMSPVTTFVVFTLLSRSTSESWLDPAKAFTSLSLISLLSNPIVYFTFALPRFTGSIACYDRIQSYLLGRGPVDPTIRISPMQEKAISSQPANGEQALLLQCNGSRESVDYLDDDVELKTLDARELPMSLRVDVTTSTWNDSGHKRETLDTGDIARLRDASFAYDPNSKPILNNLTLNIKVGEQIMVAGPVGCGKSTLLQSLVGEVYQRAGISLKQSSLQIGLCTQVPWFSNGTLREIIVGHSQFDKSWYSTVIDACALETDFAQMPLGDQTLVGAQGATLSGGQKKRIALARALYAKGQLLLLDDVLSGVDQRTEAQVVEALFGNKGICQRTGIAVILATSSPKYMMHFDTVVLLDQNGYISQQGPSVSMLNITSSLATSTDEVATSTPPESEQSVLATFAIPKIETEKSAVDPSRQHGDFSLYATYFRAMGLPLACLIMLSSLLFVICFKTPDILLQQWSLSESSTPGLHTILYISIYTLLAILALLSIILFNWLLMVTGMPIASSHLHTLVLHTTLNAPYHLLSSTPTGDLLNRFSQDMSLIDTSLPFALSKAIDGLFTLTAEALLITLSSHWTLLLLPPLLLTLYFLQSFYLRTSRQLRLLEIEAKAPLYGHFLSTLSGLPTIRAFGWTAHYSAQARAHLDYSQRPLYLLYCIQRWLGLVLDLIVAGFAVGVLAVVTQLPSSSSSSALGVSMANILTFSGTLTYVLQAWAELETSIGAVARVKAFVEGTGDEREDRENVLPPERWPDRGEARVKGVSARYGRGGEAVLKGVELEVGKGEKVGVVGRTGSGKSSLLLALLRLVELDDDGGGEIWIDGVDITRVPRGLLRERMAVVPQETPIWVGSVRMNLAVVGDDARGDDHVLLDALKRVGLLGHVMERGGLDTELNAAEWSAGQRQLLGIARVVVKAQLLDQQGGLLLLDEPTACLDEHAEEVVMDIVNEEFSGWTVIAIAHRPRALKSFDRVVVMDAGRIVREHGAKNVVGGWDL